MNPYVWFAVAVAATLVSLLMVSPRWWTAGWFVWGAGVGALGVGDVLADGWWGLLWLTLPVGAAVFGRWWWGRRRRERAAVRANFETLKAQFRANERRRAAGEQ